jgi:hypothetical protein
MPGTLTDQDISDIDRRPISCTRLDIVFSLLCRATEASALSALFLPQTPPVLTLCALKEGTTERGFRSHVAEAKWAMPVLVSSAIASTEPAKGHDEDDMHE